MIDHHAALIYAMVLASAADADMTNAETSRIGDIVQHLPVFRDFDVEDMPRVLVECAAFLDDEDGLERAYDQIRAALPEKLRETAYVLSCDIVAADGKASQEELRLLELMRFKLDIGRLPAAAIERAASARYATV